MVFVFRDLDPIGTGATIIRTTTGKYTVQLVFEAIFGVLVAIANAIIVFTMIIGWRSLSKSKFYIVLANLLICTSLKSFIELAFIIPYYILQNQAIPIQSGYFYRDYLLIIFNISVLADYGIIFFSVHIAINRFLSVTQFKGIASELSSRPGIETALSCVLVWLVALIIPVLFYIFECHYDYNAEFKVYYNRCCIERRYLMEILLHCLIYVSYTCTFDVLALYLLIHRALRKRLAAMDFVELRSSLHTTQMQLLRQSVVVFTLYAASTFVPDRWIFEIFDIAYIENLLNLSIAAIYPICFLAMSGEMKSILIRNIVRRQWISSSVRVSSVSG